MSVDAIAARREARRRKILENSERRLIQISGRAESIVVDSNLENNEHKLNGSVKSCSVTKYADRIPNGLINLGVLDSNEQKPYVQLEENLNWHTSTVADDDFNETPDFIVPSRSIKSNFALSGERLDVQKIQQSLGYQKWFHHMLLIIFGAMTRLLFALNLGHFIGMSLLVPFVTAVVLRLTLTYQSMSVAPAGMLGTVLLLSGISPRKLTITMTFLNIVTTVLEDFAVYMFTFIIIHSLFLLSSPIISSSLSPSASSPS